MHAACGGEREGGSELGWGHLGAGPRRPRQEDCVPLLPVPQTGFPLLKSYILREILGGCKWQRTEKCATMAQR